MYFKVTVQDDVSFMALTNKKKLKKHDLLLYHVSTEVKEPLRSATVLEEEAEADGENETPEPSAKRARSSDEPVVQAVRRGKRARGRGRS